MITSDARCPCEIKSRIGKHKTAFHNRKAIFTSKLDLNLMKICVSVKFGNNFKLTSGYKITLSPEKYTSCTNQTGSWKSTRDYLDGKMGNGKPVVFP